MRAILRRSSSPSPEDPTGSSRPQVDSLDVTSNYDHQNPFCDTLMTEPVLLGDSPEAEDNLGTNDKIDGDPQTTCNDQETPNNNSTTATFAGCGGNEGESGVGNYSIMRGAVSDGSSTEGAARTRTRPLSWILRGDSYVALNDFCCHENSWANRANHNCQICKDGSRCWCPVRNHTPRATPPDANSQQQHRRRSRRQSLSRCSSCGKMYIVRDTSCQWCCYGWVSGSSGSSSPDR